MTDLPSNTATGSRRGVRRAIVLPVGVLATYLGLVSVLAYHLHQQAEDEVVSSFEEQQLLVARHLATEIEADLQSLRRPIEALGRLSASMRDDPEGLHSHIADYFENLQSVGVAQISVCDDEGLVTFSTDPAAIGKSCASSDFFAWARTEAKTGRVFLSSPGPEGAQELPTRGGHLVLATPVILTGPIAREATAAERFGGAVTVAIELRTVVSSQLDRMGRSGGTSDAWVMDDDGTLLFHNSHPEMVLRNIRSSEAACGRCHLEFGYVEQMLVTRQGTVRYHVRDGEEKVAAYVRTSFANSRWIVVVVSPWREVTSFVARVNRQAVLLIGLGIGGVLMGSLWLQRNHSRQIRMHNEAEYWRGIRSLEERVRQSEARYRTIVETSHDLIWTLDPALNFTFLNSKAGSVFGGSAADLSGKRFTPLIHPEDLPTVLRVLQETLRGASHSYDLRVLDKTGNLVLLAVDTVPMLENAAIVGTLSFGADITEKRRAEQEVLNRTHELSVLYGIDRAAARSLDLDAILNDALDATLEALEMQAGCITLLDPDRMTHVLRVHRGIPSAALESARTLDIGGGVAARVGETREPAAIDLKSCPQGSAADIFGTAGYATLAATPLLSGGELLGVLYLATRRVRMLASSELALLKAIGSQLGGVVRNAQLYDTARRELAERVAAEEKLRIAEERYRKLFEQSPDGILIIDPATQRAVEFNARAHEQLGYSREEFSTKRISDYEAVEEGGQTRAHVEKIVREGADEFETRHRTRQGDIRDVHVKAHVVVVAEKQLLQVVFRDVTERKKLEQQYRQAQKMEAIGRLAGGVAHDFNNLLTVILGYGGALATQLGEHHESSADVAQILKAAERAAGLTHQLLAFSRKQNAAPEVLDLNGLVTNLEKMLRRLIGEDVLLKISLDSMLGRIKADPTQLEQVIMNLCVNARDAMPGGGTLTIETRNSDFDDDRVIDCCPIKAGRYAALSVRDTGVGMDAETKSHLFEPFFTTKEAGKGTGLGLATVYGIVLQCRGTICVSSELGAGTTIIVYLPVEESVGKAEHPGHAVRTARGGTETILVVEDEEAVRELVREVLERRGHKVLVAAGPQEALGLLAGFDGTVHMVISDIVMPGMSGPDLVRQLGRSHPDMKVLYISGYTEDAAVYRGRAEAGISYLEKPFSSEVLMWKVREVLENR